MEASQQKHREIVEEERFKEELAKLIGDARRADEFIDGAKWVLSRRPTAGTPIGTGVVHFLSIAESSVADPIVLFYAFDDNYVHFLSIRKTQYPPRETE
jgi:hypothetical protein